MRKDQYKHGRIIVSRISYDQSSKIDNIPMCMTDISGSVSGKINNFPKGLRGNGKHTYMMLPTQCGRTVRTSYPKPSNNIATRKSKKRSFDSLGYTYDNPWNDGLEDVLKCCDKETLIYPIDDLSNMDDVIENLDDSIHSEHTHLSKDIDITPDDDDRKEELPVNELSCGELKKNKECSTEIDSRQSEVCDVPDETLVSGYLTDFPLLGTSPVSSEMTDDFCKLGSFDDWCLA